MRVPSTPSQPRITAFLREKKHQAFVRLKPFRWQGYRATEPIVRAYRRLVPVPFDIEQWAGTFLTSDGPPARVTNEAVSRRIYCFWTGDNMMSSVRAGALDSIRASNPETDVILVTRENLHEHLVADGALHPAYEHLSFVHRADYLRCYMLHFHGGAYADIKYHNRSWDGCFDRFDQTSAWLMGYRNPVRLMTPNFDDRRLERIMRRTSSLRLGQSAYIARPLTPITHEWWRQVNSILDQYSGRLAAHPGGARGSLGYPLGWNQLLAQVIDPLTLKYAQHLLYDPRLFHDDSRDYL